MRVNALLALLLPKLILVASLWSMVVASPDGDEPFWPQFHGPTRSNTSDETGLLKQWPEGGPELLWIASGLGHG